MIHLFNIFCFIFFAIAVTGIFLHSCFSVYLVLILKYKKNSPHKLKSSGHDCDNLPVQVVQLPVYNENASMVKALVDSACELDYPRDKLIIQLLDDSDQQELSLSLHDYIQEKKLPTPDLQIFYLHRDNRQDYKAGNLNFGLEQLKTIIAEGSPSDPDRIIVSIFDADYLIPPDYLNRIVNCFSDPDIGIVQTATIFRNRRMNLLTRAQAIFQDNLHAFEFSGRSQADHLSMFRGSAGSLRLSTIIDAGYWQGDTQIEDVDLSFAAQCRGWKIIYDNHTVSSSLLPESYNEFKLQQRSWMKGLMEVMRKRLGQIIASGKLRPWQKILGVDFFLVLSFQSLFMVISHLTLIPAYYFWCTISTSETLNRVLLFFLALLVLTHIPFFVRKTKVGNSDRMDTIMNTWKSRLSQPLYSFYLMVAMFPTFSYGLIEGLLGVKVHRDRTGKDDAASRKVMSTSSIPKGSIDVLKKINMFEFVLAFYSIGMIMWAFKQEEYIIFTVYSTLAVIYPLNALISYGMLRAISVKKPGLSPMKKQGKQ